MKRFLLIIAASLALLVTLDQLVGRWLDRACAATTTGTQGRANYIVDSLDAPIVVFGSSRALHHYVPTIIADSTRLDCYNCGLEGLGIKTTYALVRGLNQRYEPQLIVFDLFYNIDLELGPAGAAMALVRRMPQLECRDSLLYAADPAERLRMLSRIYPHNNTLVATLLDRLTPSEHNRFGTDHGYIAEHRLIDTTQLAPYCETPKIDPFKLALLADLIERYHDRLIVCSSPVYRPCQHIDSIYSSVRALAAQHGVPFYEFGSDTAFVGKPQLWSDQWHLNHEGAKLYSTRVASLSKRFLETKNSKQKQAL